MSLSPPMPDFEMAEASKLRLRKWLVDKKQEMFYEELVDLVSDIMEEDALLRTAAVLQKISLRHLARSNQLCKLVDKKRKEMK